MVDIESSYVNTTTTTTRKILAVALYTTETNPRKRITTDILQCTFQCQMRVWVVKYHEFVYI